MCVWCVCVYRESIFNKITYVYSIIQKHLLLFLSRGGAHGVMVIVVGTGRGDTSSNPGRDRAFRIALIPWEKYESSYSLL